MMKKNRQVSNYFRGVIRNFGTGTFLVPIKIYSSFVLYEIINI